MGRHGMGRHGMHIKNQTFLEELTHLYAHDGVTNKTLNKLDCDVFNIRGPEFKKKYRKEFIKSSRSGLYEYYAKEIECLNKLKRDNNRFFESLKQNSSGDVTKDKKTKQSYIISNKKSFKRVRQICTILASEFCAIKNENAESNKYIANKLKEIPYEELGPRRKFQLMIRGYIYDDKKWNYNEELKKKFIKASEICYNNKHCLDSGSSLRDIPADFKAFLPELSSVVEKPLYYLLGHIKDLDVLQNIRKEKDHIEREQKIRDLEEKQRDPAAYNKKQLNRKIAALAEKKGKLKTNRKLHAVTRVGHQLLKDRLNGKIRQTEAKYKAKINKRNQPSKGIKKLEKKYKSARDAKAKGPTKHYFRKTKTTQKLKNNVEKSKDKLQTLKKKEINNKQSAENKLRALETQRAKNEKEMNFADHREKRFNKRYKSKRAKSNDEIRKAQKKRNNLMDPPKKWSIKTSTHNKLSKLKRESDKHTGVSKGLALNNRQQAITEREKRSGLDRIFKSSREGLQEKLKRDRFAYNRKHDMRRKIKKQI